MKREAFLKHLRKNGCILKREGGNHSIWTKVMTGTIQAVPRHREIEEGLVRHICKELDIESPF
ncbi:MAG: type II toxin-antitoxin system HicA family toxin [Candidatus Hydrogenedentes bacterium]|nr:type II toxin-antitoxin system HicA family toxin [Candidatus Hydrogenedentota bacterium]